MKRIIVIVLATAAFLAAENTADAQLLKNLLNKATGKTTETSATVSAATTNGKTAGVALKALYNQYKADGKLDMSNISNLLNLTSLANNLQGLKGQDNKTAFYKDFASGLILGSDNLVTETNTTSVMSGLTDLVSNVDLSSLTQKADTAADNVATASEKVNTAVSNATEIASSVTGILNLFKK